MRNVLVLFLIVLALVFVSTPASAQYRGDPYWGGIARIQQDMVGTPNAMLAQSLCANHRGTGDLVEQSWCYGRKYGVDGRFEGYNPQSVALGRYDRSYGYSPYYGGSYGYRRGGRGWRDAGEIVGGVAIGFVLGRATAPKDDRPQPETGPEPEAQRSEGPATIKVVVNRTGCRARVNGTILEPGGSVRVDIETSRVSVQNTACAPVYQNLQQGSVALVCSK